MLLLRKITSALYHPEGMNSFYITSDLFPVFRPGHYMAPKAGPSAKLSVSLKD